MAKKIESMIKPFMLMSDDEQLALIVKVRRNRFDIKPSMVKTAKAKVTGKAAAKKKEKAVDAVNKLSKEDKDKLIAQLKAGL